MKKAMLIFVVIAAAAVILTAVFFLKGPDLSKYDNLKEPRITVINDQKMLVVETKGDPNETGKDAIGSLFKTFYKLKGSVKGMEFSAPRARWPKTIGTPKEQWVGLFGLAVPDSLDKLPDGTPSNVKLNVWKYGETAEILHFGAYSSESPTIDKLYSFIKTSGYEIAGDHEEEYLKGPGMFFKGDPEKYVTILRYQVKKKAR